MPINPHAPFHLFLKQGTYMVTGATLYKEYLFQSPKDLDVLQSLFFDLAKKYKWEPRAWSFFSNHYHFIVISPEDPSNLPTFIRHFHASSARSLNSQHKTVGRKVWYQYWDTRLTFQNSYFARLNYVMNNSVKHKLVQNACEYKWCSAHWFEQVSPKSYYKTITNFKIDTVNVNDDF